MMKRVIENWLTNTNETNYRIPFCQVLLHNKHDVYFTHGPLENGKDIITIDHNSQYNAYQLKTGDINSTEWRNIKSQIEELTQYPIKHPSFDSSKPFCSYLVINGEIDSYARNKINEFNEANEQRHFSKLDVINLKKLVNMFNKAQGRFLPVEIENFNDFLKLFLANGNDFLPKEEFANFLYNNFFEEVHKSPKNKANDIQSSLIITSYLLNSFQQCNNYYALFEAWTCLAASIIRYAKAIPFKKEYWIDSFQLIMSEILRNLELLKEEILEKKDFFEGDIIGDNETMCKARITIILGSLSALEIYKLKNEQEYNSSNKLKVFVGENIKNMIFWGESAFPYYFNLIQYIELINKKEEANYLLEQIFLKIIHRNQLGRLDVFPNPYYSVHIALENLLKKDIERNREIDNRFNFLEDTKMDLDEILEKDLDEIQQFLFKAEYKKNKINEAISIISDKMKWKELPLNQFSGKSYILKSLILMLARRDKREILEKNWQKVSHIYFEEFKPDNIEDIFSLRTYKGVNIMQEPKRVQSWSKLVEEANSLTKTSLYNEYVDFIRFLILVYPYRATPELTSLLDLS